MRFMLWYLGMCLLVSFYLESAGHDSAASWLLGVAMSTWALAGVSLALMWLVEKSRVAAFKAANARQKGEDA